MTCRLILVMALCEGLCVPLGAQTFDLTERYAIGQEIVVSSNTTVSMGISGSGAGELKELLGGGEAMESTTKAQVRYRVLEVADGMPSRQEAKVLVIENEGDGPPMGIPSVDGPSLKGKTVAVRVSKSGKKTFTVKGGSPELEAQAGMYCRDLPTEILADIDVSSAEMGDKWSVPAKALRERFELPDKADATLTAVFEEVVEQEGKRLAKLSLDIKISGGPDEEMPASVSMDLQGYYFFDLDTGLPYYIEAAGPMTFAFSFAGFGEGPAGDDLSFSMTGELQAASVYQLVSQPEA